MIGVFDSGLGGVTVLKELIKKMPNEHFVYYSDSINNPYGDKTKEEVIKLSDKVTRFLIDKGCKIIVIACNTASCSAREYLRKKYKDIKFIVTEPAVKRVYDDNKNANMLVLATERTINSENLKELIEKYHTKNTYLCSMQHLADLIEEEKDDEIDNLLDEKLSKYSDKNIDSIVLGCTHYPLVKDKIKLHFKNAKLYDGAEGVAKQAKRIFEKEKIESNYKLEIDFYDSKDNKREKLFYKLLSRR